MSSRNDHIGHCHQLRPLHGLGLAHSLASPDPSHVVYGIFRYIYLVQVKNEGGAPDETLYKDKPILLTVILYVATVIAILVLAPIRQ